MIKQQEALTRLEKILRGFLHFTHDRSVSSAPGDSEIGFICRQLESDNNREKRTNITVPSVEELDLEGVRVSFHDGNNGALLGIRPLQEASDPDGNYWVTLSYPSTVSVLAFKVWPPKGQVE